MKLFLASAVILVVGMVPAFAGENLRINPKLDYTNDSQNGPLITGDQMKDGVAAEKPAYVFMYGEGCFNSKRQARHTVSLYEKYRGQVQFVIIDLDHSLSSAQQELRKKYYKGYIPHVVVLDSSGAALYNSAGEVDESVIIPLLDKVSR
jgi:hypothetical protein